MLDRSLRAFTLIELLVVISIIALLIAILLPALGEARVSAQQLQSTTQLRGIHQGFVIYAQDNDTFFPGVVTLQGSSLKDFLIDGNKIDTIQGNNSDAGESTTARVAYSLEQQLFPPSYAISPGETSSKVKEWEPDGSYSRSNDHLTSYAFLKFAEGNVSAKNNGRVHEWRDTVNGRAIAIGDRATDMRQWNNADTYTSLWSKDVENWRGAVVYNDNSTFFSFDQIVEDTNYNGHQNTEPDDLFIGAYDRNVGKNGGDKANNCDLAVGNGGNWLSAE